MKKLAIILLALIIFSSCKKDIAAIPPDLDPSRFPLQIQPILKTFLAEGNKRGVYLDINKLKKIILQGNKLTADGAPAQAYYDPSLNTIIIDTNSIDWYRNRESIIFHELGHGLLKRVHKNDLFKSLDPSSIMNCCRYPDYYYPDLAYKRQYYCDELFHQNTPYPDWSN